MTSLEPSRLLVCYISGLDLRRINPDWTPFIADLFDLYPWVRITNLPSNDLLPTIVTGTYPPEHGIWGVKLKSNATQSLTARLIDKLPDIVTTTAQCIIHALTNSFDLAAIPPRRRRLFEIKRTKYLRRNRLTEALLRIGEVESCLSVVGKDQSRYIYSSTFYSLNKLLSKLASGTHTLELLELYSLDLFQQWNLNGSNKVRKFHRRIDRFVGNLYEKCRGNGITLVLISDHGHEEVKGWIDLKGELGKLNLPDDEYTFFMEVSIGRLWFRTERARHEIVGMLRKIENTVLLSYQDMDKYHLSFPELQYGEVFVVADPGYIFFPHDFYHPLGNLYLGLTRSMQRGRLLNPRQRANHGYLPEYQPERAFMIVLDKSYKAIRHEGDLIDVAPSLLGLAGYEKPVWMKGTCVFQH